jgi:hypothetical protein
LWWTKWRRGRFSPSTSVSPAIHSTKFSILTITRGRYNRTVSGPSLDSTSHYANLHEHGLLSRNFPGGLEEYHDKFKQGNHSPGRLPNTNQYCDDRRDWTRCSWIANTSLIEPYRVSRHMVTRCMPAFEIILFTITFRQKLGLTEPHIERVPGILSSPGGKQTEVWHSSAYCHVLVTRQWIWISAWIHWTIYNS